MERAKFPEHLQDVRDLAPQLITLMEQNPDWYASFHLQEDTSLQLRSDTRQDSVNKEFIAGARLRIYDGETFYESATHDLSEESLIAIAHELVAKVENNTTGNAARPYSPSGWADRDVAALDEEIQSQLPDTLTEDTEVHFGVRYEVNPFEIEVDELLKIASGNKERIEGLAHDIDLNMIVSRLGMSQEVSLFVDRKVNMSQTILKTDASVVPVKGDDYCWNVIGGLGGLEIVDHMTDEDFLEMLQALDKMESAEQLEPGTYTIITGPDVTGVLAHEAFGHSQEGDTWARGRSIARDLFDAQTPVGNEHATIINNPAMFTNGAFPFGAWGSYFFDEEGWLAQEQVILKKGILQPPMTNLSSALRLGVPRTANGKRQNWKHADYTRQTNTYFAAGEETLNDLISLVEYGFLAMESAGGMEDPKAMGIQVGIAYLQEIKDGELTGRIFKGPAGGAIQMTGYVPDLLHSIVGRSKTEYWTEEADSAVFPENKKGGCGKYHKEWVPAGCGGPCLLLEDVLLG